MARTYCCVAAWVVALAAVASDRAAPKLPDAAQAALEKADQVEVTSLDPRGGDESKAAFHEYKVLGKTTVKDEDTRKSLTAAVAKGVAESDGAIAKCFDPRHGLRAVYKGKMYDFVICYACSQIELHVGDEEPATIATTAASRAFLDKLLGDAGALPADKDK